MSSMYPQSQHLKNAVKWVSEQRAENSDKRLGKLVEEATFRFDLSPKDAEFLIKFFRQQENPG